MFSCYYFPVSTVELPLLVLSICIVVLIGPFKSVHCNGPQTGVFVVQSSIVLAKGNSLAAQVECVENNIQKKSAIIQ